jgi:hypothetical protein
MATPSSKHTQAGGFGNEFSGTLTDEHHGWGTDAPLNPVGSEAGFPWLTFEHDVEVVTERDASINSSAFETSERETGRLLDKTLSFNNRVEGIDKQLPWMYGFENRTQKVMVMQINEFSDAPAGTIFTDTTNTYYLLRQEESKLITGKTAYWATLVPVTPSTEPPTQAGVLTDVGTTYTDINHLSFDADMYEHLYEVSNDGKIFRDFTTAEYTALGTQAVVDEDKRTCMATLVKKFPEYSYRFQNTKCYKFGYKWTPQKFTEITCNWLGYSQERIRTTDPEYSNIDYTMPCPTLESNNILAHNQSRLEIGLADVIYTGENYTFQPFTDGTLDFEIPLDKVQDSESGLFLVDPVLSGSIKMMCNITLTRALDDTFQQYRDDRTNLSGRISSRKGFSSQEILIKKFTLPKAGPDNGDVAAEPLDFSISLTCGTHAFDTWLKNDTGTNPEIMGSPVVKRVINKNPYNEMTGRDLTGARRP